MHFQLPTRARTEGFLQESDVRLIEIKVSTELLIPHCTGFGGATAVGLGVAHHVWLDRHHTDVVGDASFEVVDLGTGGRGWHDGEAHLWCLGPGDEWISEGTSEGMDEWINECINV